jgi:hypothetical protein
MSYVVAKIVKEQSVEGKWGPQIRTAFTVNEFGNEKVLSAFSKFPLKEGQTLEGTIEEQVKDGKTFHNFKFQPKGTSAPSGDLNRVEVKVDALRAEIATLGGVLRDMRGVLGSLLQRDQNILDSHVGEASEMPEF